jgi:putative endonuclease
MKSHELGQQGESFAHTFLRQQGYEIVQTNYRTRIGEIDVIAKEGGMFVFIEVKTRQEDGWDAFEAVHKNKQHKMRRVAEQYLIETFGHVDVLGRFDVLAVYAAEDGSLKGELLRNAF